MWTKWPRYIFVVTWVLLQVPGTVVSGLRHKTACYTFPLNVDPPCSATEMLLPIMFTLGVSSDVTCHSEIAGASLRQKGPDEIRRCCQQRETDTMTEFCLPARKNQLTDDYYLDFVNTCTASTTCQLSSSAGVHHTDGEDYVTFTFDCVHKYTVLHIQHDATHTGHEVYLYNDQHDGYAKANCIAYSHECDSRVIIQLAAARVVSPVCQVTFTDGDVSVKVDCKNPPATSNCSSTMFESKSNYVNMSIFMTVDPGRQEKEFLWTRVKTNTGKNVTVVCGANIPSDVSLNCPTSTSTTTTTTPTTTTPTTTTVVTAATAAVAATGTPVATATATSTTTVTPKQATMAPYNTVSTQTPGLTTPSTGKSQVVPYTVAASSKTSIHSNGATTLSTSSRNGVTPSTTPHQHKSNTSSTHPSHHHSGLSSSGTSSPMGKGMSTPEATNGSRPSMSSKESTSPRVTKMPTSTKEPKPSTPSKEVFIIGGSVGGAVLLAIMVTITVCVRRKKRKSSEKTDQKPKMMDESQENWYTSNGVRNSDGDKEYNVNPVYEGTDDYKMEQLQRKSYSDETCDQETESPYAVSGPPRLGMSLRKNSWVTQRALDYFDDILFNDKPSGEDSEERGDVQVSDLYAKVNKPQRTDQVTDIYAKVDKSRNVVQ